MWHLWKREVKTRMEEPGGGWRSEDFSNLFSLSIKSVCSWQLAGVDIQINTPVHLWAQFWASWTWSSSFGESEGFVTDPESYVDFFQYFWVLDTGWRPKVLARINKSQDDLRLFLVVEDQETNNMLIDRELDAWTWIRMLVFFTTSWMNQRLVPGLGVSASSVLIGRPSIDLLHNVSAQI